MQTAYCLPWQVFYVLLALLAVSGCNSNDALSTVEGSISVDGKSVPSGTASFTPLDGGKAVSADIVQGKYKAENVARGRNLVHLNAFVATGGKFVELGIEYPEEKNVIPQKYHAGVELTVDQPVMLHDFDLTSK